LAIAGAAASLVAVTALVLAQSASAATAFSANFEDGSISSWSKSGGDWSVVTDGSKVLTQTKSDSENAREFAGDTGWTDISTQARVKPLSLGSGGFVGLLARASGSTSFYRLALLPGNLVQLQAVNSGSVTVLGSASRTVSTGTWYTLRIDTTGSTIAGYVDGTQIASASSSAIAKGRIGLQTAYSSANYDDVVVTTGGTTTPTTAGPTTTRAATTAAPTTRAPATTTRAPSTTSAPPATGVPTGAWPTKTGDISLSNGTISVSGTYDGGMKRICCIGDGGQSESQDPVFELANGATIKNVIIGSPAGDGIHCLGTCTIQNVWWEDVGEDGATFLQTNGGTSYVIGGGAKSASDKVFQHNGNGTVNISGFYAESIGKLYRGCGNCTNSYQRHVVVNNVLLNKPSYVVGINTNWGDTATLRNIYITGTTSGHICAEYKGVAKGSEPTYLGDGVNDAYCKFTSSDIHYQ
jgi:hypothetical protein